jgi:hypothetical protein
MDRAHVCVYLSATEDPSNVFTDWKSKMTWLPQQKVVLLQYKLIFQNVLKAHPMVLRHGMMSRIHAITLTFGCYFHLLVRLFT